ncbi:unnamed protein product [Caenorhabditis nigoni]
MRTQFVNTMIDALRLPPLIILLENPNGEAAEGVPEEPVEYIVVDPDEKDPKTKEPGVVLDVSDLSDDEDPARALTPMKADAEAEAAKVAEKAASPIEPAIELLENLYEFEDSDEEYCVVADVENIDYPTDLPTIPAEIVSIVQQQIKELVADVKECVREDTRLPYWPDLEFKLEDSSWIWRQLIRMSSISSAENFAIFDAPTLMGAKKSSACVQDTNLRRDDERDFRSYALQSWTSALRTKMSRKF